MKITFQSSKAKRDKANAYAKKRKAKLSKERKEKIKLQNKQRDLELRREIKGLLFDGFLQQQSAYYADNKPIFDKFYRLQDDTANHNRRQHWGR